MFMSVLPPYKSVKPCVGLVQMDARRGYQTFWDWSYKSCEPPCVCWESKPALPEEHPVLLNSEASLHLPNLCFFFFKGVM